MANTSDLKLFLLKENIKIDILSQNLIKEKKYIEIDTKKQIQTQMGVSFRFFISNTYNKPDWYNLIKAYITLDRKNINLDSNSELMFYNHSFIGIINYKNNNYIICGGGGANTLYKDIEPSFGIKILERIFNPDENKIEMVDDKGLIGDILASSRYYRRGRSLLYEDDFGKYFQKILVRLTKKQIFENFPAYANYRKNVLGESLAISGSNSLSISGKIDFITLIKTIKDLSQLLIIEPKQIFNTKLKPLNGRNDASLIKKLEKSLIFNIIKSLFRGEKIDFDIGTNNIEEFYSSSMYEIYIPNISFKNSSLTNTILSNDIDRIRNGSFTEDIIKLVIASIEYKKAIMKPMFCHKLFNTIYLKTFDSSSLILTEGKLIDYIQIEQSINGVSYFLLDKVWYELKNQFDVDLSEKYKKRVVKNIKDLSFIKKWPSNLNEDQYNLLYDNKENPLFLHKVLINKIEICDILYVEKNLTYIIHVKDDLDAKVRDLTSQAFISSRIVEEEKRIKNKNNLKKLYKSAVINNRIDKSKISEEKFISYFCENQLEYCLVLRPKNKSNNDIINGLFDSRIAKFSLFELSTIMYGSELKLNIILR